MDVNQKVQQSQLQNSLMQLATRLRDAFEEVVKSGDAPEHLRNFPESCCGTVCELVGEYLNTMDIGEFHYVCAMNGSQSHAWLEGCGFIIDITADQFPGRPRIYVDAKDSWYAQWDERSRQLAIHEPSSYHYGDERQLIRQVLEHMTQPGAAAG
ncbi:hypothetical protein E6B08_17565 [Pseudomonas putida]|uniref:Uncharacterized protein n=1 Tax=Pseudomonas putida TaxID=303 RepID=A0A4D6XB82_PSEPU|nr:hypothetical protein [Pseudomonas putida]QCI13067.1 hypothetical protein E6B08_17565 [Pseudomonas putida]